MATEPAVHAPRTDNVLEMRDLHLVYTGQQRVVHAIQHANLVVRRGESVGIAGESGSGKSTLARAAMGLLPLGAAKIVGGKIIVNGIEATAYTPSQWQRLRGNPIAIVFQDPLSFLNPVVRIGDQIAESVRQHDPDENVQRRVNKLLDMVQLPAVAAQRHPHELSGGMRQRVMMAIALGCRPSLLIADEPTTALDVTTQADILKLLADLRTELNMSLLLISHDLGVLRQSCERTYIMYAGHTVESGRTADVLRRPLHPYTRGLIEASRMRLNEQRRFSTIRGDGPTLNQRYTLCPFLARCSSAVADCRSRMPELQDVEAGRAVRCWAAQEQLTETPHGAV
ncbi:MAG TPA: ABC transporter ATP-binding protein [Burkholderiaceae bacterium]|jgi:oligopeptide/dipeptide ABC transporter ATP-binding protein